jgi:hypothetical protein
MWMSLSEKTLYAAQAAKTVQKLLKTGLQRPLTNLKPAHPHSQSR